MTTLVSVRRHLSVETQAVWKLVHWLALRASGPVCTYCGFSCWRVFSNGPSGLGLRRFFSVVIIFNAKFVLDLGMVSIQRGLQILGCLWNVLIISTLKYVLKWLPTGTCVMSGQVNWLVEQIDELFPAWCSFYWKVVRRPCYITGAGMESILQSCVMA